MIARAAQLVGSRAVAQTQIKRLQPKLLKPGVSRQFSDFVRRQPVFLGDQPKTLLHDQIRIRHLHEMRNFPVREEYEFVLHQIQGSWPICGIKPVEPQRQAFNESSTRPETLIVVVLVVRKQLKFGNMVLHRLGVLPPHHPRQQFGCVEILHGYPSVEGSSVSVIANFPGSMIRKRSKYQSVASTSRLCPGASFHPRSKRLDGMSTLSEKRCSRSDTSFPGQAPWSPIVTIW